MAPIYKLMPVESTAFVDPDLISEKEIKRHLSFNAHRIDTFDHEEYAGEWKEIYVCSLVLIYRRTFNKV